MYCCFSIVKYSYIILFSSFQESDYQLKGRAAGGWEHPWHRSIGEGALWCPGCRDQDPIGAGDGCWPRGRPQSSACPLSAPAKPAVQFGGPTSGEGYVVGSPSWLRCGRWIFKKLASGLGQGLPWILIVPDWGSWYTLLLPILSCSSQHGICSSHHWVCRGCRGCRGCSGHISPVTAATWGPGGCCCYAP